LRKPISNWHAGHVQPSNTLTFPDFFRLKISAAERTFKNDGNDLKRSEANLENLLVKTPFAGRVIGLAMRAGQDVPISAKLLTLADISQLIVKGNVDATSAGRVQPGQAVRVTVGDKPIVGKFIRGTS
jgi:multidrug resistance efflux pump